MYLLPGPLIQMFTITGLITGRFGVIMSLVAVAAIESQ